MNSNSPNIERNSIEEIYEQFKYDCLHIAMKYLKNQTLEYASIYEISTGSEVNKIEDRVRLRYYFPEQIKALLCENGFEIYDEHETDSDIYFVIKLN